MSRGEYSTASDRKGAFMFPVLFKFKFITIAGFGIMLGIGFYLAFLLFEREMTARGKGAVLANQILLAIVPSAIVGAKIFHLIENPSVLQHDPLKAIFSGAGLSAYGGFILCFITSAIVIRINRESILEVFDTVSAPMALGYAIGRIGCHVAGDGCFGIKTSSFWGISYPNGIVPTDSYVFPTPLFESLVSFIIFFIIMRLRKRELTPGYLFFTYLILSGIPRFFVEYIRLNPLTSLGFTQAQIIAVFSVLAGATGLLYIKNNRCT